MPLRPTSLPLLLPAGLALGAAALAQVGPTDYSHNWAPMHQLPNTAFAGDVLFGYFTQGQHYPTTGDAIRRCYGFDSTQGGRNESAGVWESSWFKLAQGYAPGNAIAGVDIGTVTVLSASDSSLAGDPLVAPLVQSVGNTGGSQISATLSPGLVSATAGYPFPQVWEIAFQWTGPGVGTHGLTGPVTLGTDAGGGGAGLPLLTHVILQTEGPATGGPLNNQYYMASTTEVSGTNALGPGGLANGNALLASSFFNGQQAQVTGALGCTRFLVNHPFFGQIAASPLFVAKPGDTEFAGMMAFQSPVLWATKDGKDGAGGTDWQASAAPVSVVDLRLLDQLSGAEGNANIDAKFGGVGAPAAAFDSTLVFNQSFFLWSASFAASMPQKPTSWDDLGGTLPPQPGSAVLGLLPTSREGNQHVPIVFDGLTASVLNFSGLSLGKAFSASEDPVLDGLVIDPQNSSHSSLFEGMFDPLVSGISTLSGGPFAVAPSPQAQLAGQKLGVAALGLQIHLGPGGAFLSLTEVASSLEINLQ